MSTSRGVSVQSARTPPVPVPVHCYTYDTYNRGDLRLWSRQKKGLHGTGQYGFTRNTFMEYK